MSRSRSKQPTAQASAAPGASNLPAVVPSLPPAPDQALTPSTKLKNSLSADSMVRKKAVAIIAMRAQGFTTDEIAKELGIKPKSVTQYVYQATKAGFLVNKRGESMLTDPADRLEFDLAHKAVRNFSAALDDSPVVTEDGEVKPLSDRMWEATKVLTSSVITKRFDQTSTPSLPNMNVLAVRVEVSAAGAGEAREGSIGGTPAYVEGETNEE